MLKTVSVVTLLLASAWYAAACSSDTYVATNETLSGGGTKGSGGHSGTSGNAGTGVDDDAWPSGGSAGAAGSAGSAGNAGNAGAAGAGGAPGECTPGVKQDLGTCQKCGTSRRTCDTSGHWGSPACEDQKECNPGDKTTSGCSDPCAEKTCGADCSFGGCGVKSGATCLYKSGSSYQCCGAGKCQFCNDATCDWYSCQPCGCTSCGC